MIRTLLLAAGLTALGVSLSKRMSQRSLPMADGPLDAQEDTSESRQKAGELQQRRVPLEAGMPTDMSNDADRARPGFADYARGA
ncbi:MULTISPECIES: hypothetical protein [unclassified Roseateles]|uniref:hypothetical protein n=1 Tax=unclassified Roseateles TaxID=2626991 RepID=UPI0006F2E620|nr:MULTISPECIES: hypothetical protein [unclassified Roseateles]KQW50790.1 hypothetical protein ASC81_24145 [Pelomonas sp. Root405]KRA70851.1 hypothetical protein ASD88_13470 [Pelomonas sp. Root662]